eukprot:3418623-Pleurochrysis_carterae.AAC.4
MRRASLWIVGVVRDILCGGAERCAEAFPEASLAASSAFSRSFASDGAALSTAVQHCRASVLRRSIDGRLTTLRIRSVRASGLTSSSCSREQLDSWSALSAARATSACGDGSAVASATRQRARRSASASTCSHARPWCSIEASSSCAAKA